MVLFDPTFSEEFNGDSLLSISILKKSFIKNIIYGYEPGLSEESLLNIYKISFKNYSFLGNLIKKLLIQKFNGPLQQEMVLIA